MVVGGVGASLGGTKAVICGWSDGALTGSFDGKWVGEKEGSLFWAVEQWQVPQVTIQSV